METRVYARRIFDVLLGVGLITMGTIGLAYFRDSGIGHSSQDERSLFVSVGNLVTRKGNVRYRFSDSAVWHDLGKTEKVSFGDAIFTASDSSAELHFKTGNSAEILPNSLVVIRNQVRGPKGPSSIPLIDLKKGHLRLSHVKAGVPIRIAARGKIYKLVPKPKEGMRETTLDISLPDKPIAQTSATPGRSDSASPGLVVQSDAVVELVQAKTEPVPPGDNSETAQDLNANLERAPAAAPSEGPEVTPSPFPSTSDSSLPTAAFAIPSSSPIPTAAAAVTPLKAPPETAKKPANDTTQITPAANTTPRASDQESFSPAPSPSPEPEAEPAPESKPTPVKETAQKTINDDHGKAPNKTPDETFRASIGYQSTSLSATDATSGSSAKINSSHDIRLAVAWTQAWSNRLVTNIEFSLRTIAFEPSNSATKTLVASSNTPTHFTVGADYSLSSPLKLTGALSYGQELFIRGLTSSEIQVDSQPLFSARLGLDYSIYRLGALAFGAQAAARYLTPGSSDAYSIRSGYELQGGFYLEQHFGHEDRSAFRVDLGYLSRTQNTSVVKQTESSVFLGASFSFPVFGRK